MPDADVPSPDDRMRDALAVHGLCDDFRCDLVAGIRPSGAGRSRPAPRAAGGATVHRRRRVATARS